jgi:hypothetical protein
MGRDKRDGLDYSDTISLIELRRGAEIELHNQITQELEPKAVGRRGRSRKPKDKPKFPKLPTMGKPKFIQLEEAMKEGGGRLRKRKQEAEKKEPCDGGIVVKDSAECLLQEDVPPPTPAQCPFQEAFLEVVLPAIQTTPISGLNLLQQGDREEGLDGSAIIPETIKLLQIQQEVGFCYNETDEEVVKVLTIEEQRDRSKKQIWEQKNGSQ